MTAAPIPEDEGERLTALYRLLILDTPPQERFDKIVAFAAYEFEAPIVLISLVDRNRQWFKSKLGIAVCETARDISFCGHTIMHPAIMVVPETAADPRFSDNPLVTGAPFIRFYAGAPLILASGHAAGTLCVIDTVPREFDDISIAILSTLRDLVVQELVSTDGSSRV